MVYLLPGLPISQLPKALLEDNYFLTMLNGVYYRIISGLARRITPVFTYTALLLYSSPYFEPRLI